MAELYESDRVSRISTIARRFATAVRVGDEVEFGLVGDPHFPPDYRSSRPKGTVVKVKGTGTDSASIRVRLSSGKVVDVMPHTIDPRRVWEFSADSFEKVLARNKNATPEAQQAEAEYRGAEKGTYSALIAKVDALSTRLDEEIRENRTFNGALVASFSELAGEVQKVSPDSPFCKTFREEYSGMLSSSQAPGQDNPFDSDFSDED